MSKLTVLTACVKHLRAAGHAGKRRDDAAVDFFAGAVAADPSLGDLTKSISDTGYVGVLEALAVAAEESEPNGE